MKKSDQIIAPNEKKKQITHVKRVNKSKSSALISSLVITFNYLFAHIAGTSLAFSHDYESLFESHSKNN
jgi:hypothetical protein